MCKSAHCKETRGKREGTEKKLHSHSEVKHSQSEIEVNRCFYHLLWVEVCALLDITTRQLVLRGH